MLLTVLLLLIPMNETVKNVQYYQAEKLYLRSLQDVWIATGVMCEADREIYFINLGWEEWDRKRMVERLALMNSTTPPFSDELYLPSKDYADYAYSIADDYLHYLYGRWKWAGCEQERLNLTAVIQETKQRQQFYHFVRQVRGNILGSGKRVTLEELRSFVGSEAYASKKWPTPLPPEAYLFDWPNTKPLLVEYEK